MLSICVPSTARVSPVVGGSTCPVAGIKGSSMPGTGGRKVCQAQIRLKIAWSVLVTHESALEMCPAISSSLINRLGFIQMTSGFLYAESHHRAAFRKTFFTQLVMAEMSPRSGTRRKRNITVTNHCRSRWGTFRQPGVSAHP